MSSQASASTGSSAASPASVGAARRRFYIAPRNWFLLAVFAGLSALWLAGDGSGVVSERAVRPLFDVFDADRAQLVVLERADVAAVETGGVERSTLRLQPASAGAADAGGAAWEVQELFGAKALRERVERLLSRIGSMTTLDLVSADPARHEEYGLTEARALRVRVAVAGELPADSAETPMVDLLLAPAPNRGAWVRKWGEDEVWRIARFSPPSPSPRAWFDDSSLMPLGDRALRFIGATGRAISRDVAIRFVPGGERFVDAAGEAWSAPRVLDIHSRLQMLFPVNVVGAKPAGEPLDPSSASKSEDGSATPPWLRIEITPLISGKSFHIELSEPEVGAAECEAVVVEGTNRVTVASSTARQLALALEALLQAQDAD